MAFTLINSFSYPPPLVPMAGLVGWWAADSLALSNGAHISAWADLSGAGHTMTQGTSGQQPIFTTGLLNGKPGAVFTAANSCTMQTAAVPTAATVFSMFLVLKTTSPGATEGIVRCGDGTSGYGFIVNGTGRSIFIPGTSSPVDGSATTLAEIWSATTSAAPLNKMWVNGASVALNHTNSPLIAPADFATFGVLNSASGLYYDGSIFEVLMYNAALSDPDRVLVENYLNAKYAVF